MSGSRAVSLEMKGQQREASKAFLERTWGGGIDEGCDSTSLVFVESV